MRAWNFLLLLLVGNWVGDRFALNQARLAQKRGVRPLQTIFHLFCWSAPISVHFSCEVDACCMFVASMWILLKLLLGRGSPTGRQVQMNYEQTRFTNGLYTALNRGQ